MAKEKTKSIRMVHDPDPLCRDCLHECKQLVGRVILCPNFVDVKEKNRKAG